MDSDIIYSVGRNLNEIGHGSESRRAESLFLHDRDGVVGFHGFGRGGGGHHYRHRLGIERAGAGPDIERDIVETSAFETYGRTYQPVVFSILRRIFALHVAFVVVFVVYELPCLAVFPDVDDSEEVAGRGIVEILAVGNRHGSPCQSFRR